jgi:HAD superfamily 5'-nucleotidase-like hydrolase
MMMMDFGAPTPQRSVFCNRTLNLRSIGAIGYDMDYTLIQYNVVEWETLAYAYAKAHLLEGGWPIEPLVFDPDMMIQGLIIDTELGNLLKVNRFGYVKSAFHGTEPLPFEVQRQVYSRLIIDHREPRYVFLSTLFSISEACLFAQLVELWEADGLPEVRDYADLYQRARHAIDAAHREGRLKAEIAASFERYVDLDAETCSALLDQQDAGKKLLLITNSDWTYTRRIMAYAFDRYLPKSMTWRDLFDVIIVSARKPDFFSSRSPLLEVVDDAGLLRPTETPPERGRVYFGGNASLVEAYLGLSGDQILFVGDHFFGDVHATKSTLRWRTALVVRDLEGDLAASEAFQAQQVELNSLMVQKEKLESLYWHARLELQHARKGREPQPGKSLSEVKRRSESLRADLARLDERIAPLARIASRLGNENWGLLMRAGNDKSYLAHLVERHADIYTTRVSNFLYQTPFAYFRSARGSLPHDDLLVLD